MVDFVGGNDDDIFTGDATSDTVFGNGGNDALNGGSGTDIVVGGTGADTISGGDDDDLLFSYTRVGSAASAYFPNFSGLISSDIFVEVDQLTGGTGDDIIFAGYGDIVDGGAQGSFGNRLFVSFQGSTVGVNADFRILQTQGSITIGGGTITNIQNIGSIEGSNFDDFLVPIDTFYPSGANVFGRGGNDTIIADYYAGWGSSGIWGDDGDDDIDATGAQYGPRVYGGAGNDTIRMRSGLGDVAYGEAGNDTIYAGGETHGGLGNDLIILAFTYYGGVVTGDEGDDEIRASESGNRVSGGSGADFLVGNSGNDIFVSGSFIGATLMPTDDDGMEFDNLQGNGGDDTLYIGFGDSADGGSGSDIVSISLGGATAGVSLNTVAMAAGGNLTIGGGLIKNIETLSVLKGSSFVDDFVIGTHTSRVTVNSGDGNDRVQSSLSSITYNGGNGDDLFVTGRAADIFDGGVGIDTIDYELAIAGVTVSLGLEVAQIGAGGGSDSLANVENIAGSGFADTLNGSNGMNLVEGRAGNDTINGRGGADTLLGGEGDDTLNGGTGNDTLNGDAGSNILSGGADNDTYIITQGNVTITEYENEGIDEVRTNRGSFTLGANVENLTYIGIGSFVAVGNAIANTLTGGAAYDELYGMEGNDTLSEGGPAADALFGGQGDDIYNVTVRGSSTLENAGEGIDEVRTTFSIYGLQSNIENLTFTDNAVHRAGVGNILDNVLTGGTGVDDLLGRAGNDTLRGGTGAANTLLGQEGDDIYVVAASGDSVIEFANQGTDTVQTALSVFTLRDNVENLIYIGSATFTGIGASGDNMITGGVGADFLSGLGGNDIIIGGSSADTMLGGMGSDQFRYLGGETGLDRILDFTSGADKIALLGTAFTRTATIDFIQTGAPMATSANSTFLYDVNNGIVSYDADGTGAGVAVQIAQLNAGLTLAAGDFIFY